MATPTTESLHEDIIRSLIDPATPVVIELDQTVDRCVRNPAGRKQNFTGDSSVDYVEGSKYFDQDDGIKDMRLYVGPNFNYLTAEEITREHLNSFVYQDSSQYSSHS